MQPRKSLISACGVPRSGDPGGDTGRPNQAPHRLAQPPDRRGLERERRRRGVSRIAARGLTLAQLGERQGALDAYGNGWSRPNLTPRRALGVFENIAGGLREELADTEYDFIASGSVYDIEVVIKMADALASG